MKEKILQRISFKIITTTTDNNYSWVSKFKSALTCTPNRYKLLKSLMPISLNLLARGGIHASMAMSNWYDSASLYFIWDSFPLHLVRNLMKGSLDPCFVLSKSWRDTSNWAFSPYYLIKAEHNSFQSCWTCASRV